MSQDGIWQTVDTLTFCHEEAETQMLLHAKHAKYHRAAKVVIYIPHTDVFILMLCFLGDIGELYMKTGKDSKKRVINIDVVKQQIEPELAGGIEINKFYAALQSYTRLEDAIQSVHLLVKVKLTATTCYERILSLSKA